MDFQAQVWYPQLRLEEAKLEVLHALEIYEKLGATSDVPFCEELLRNVDQAIADRSTNSRGEPLETVPRPTFVDLQFPV